MAYPKHWRTLVKKPQTDAEIDAIRRCVARGQPYGSEDWVRRTAGQLGLESTLRAPEHHTDQELRVGLTFFLQHSVQCRIGKGGIATKELRDVQVPGINGEEDGRAAG